MLKRKEARLRKVFEDTEYVFFTKHTCEQTVVAIGERHFESARLLGQREASSGDHLIIGVGAFEVKNTPPRHKFHIQSGISFAKLIHEIFLVANTL